MSSMQYGRAPLICLFEDDVDRLFNRLQVVEAPDAVVQRILSRIKDLPRPAGPPQSPGEAQPVGLPTADLDSLVVRNERREPS